MASEGQFDALEKIGHGSFGIIRKVRRQRDGFIMCRKEISYLRMSQKEREQLHAEFQILSNLKHPNIVAYYHREHLKMSQDLHLYMEYCGNGDLGRVIKDLQHKGQRAPENFVWSIFSQLVLALYRCHYGVNPPEVGTNVLGLTHGTTHGAPKVPPGTMTILHRDLKPENVFLDEDNSVKLGDFGLSKMIKSHDFASTYVGTPFYMSPEICAAEKYTLKSDIWSLGCIIYELCSREPPFNAKTHFQLVQRIKEGKVVPLPEMYSAELNQVIKDCLRVNPDRRPDTTQLLNLPIVKLMRKEKEVADLNKKLRTKADELSKKEEEINDKLANLDHDLELKKAEIDLSLRREWEVKAHLEIERLAQVEVERLKKVFDEAVRVQVEERLRKVEEQPRAETPASPPAAQVAPVAKPDRPDYPHSSIGTSSDEFSSTTDVTDLSVDSSDHHNEPKKTARTPFGRAQTMFVGNAGTPMDISPSPVALASLSLSPRRTGAAKAPHLPDGNIFSKNNGSEDPKWTIPRESLEDSEEDDFFVPSPTRQIKSTQHNPFTSKSRPVLTSQKSCPINRLRPQPSSSGLVSKVGLGQPPEPTARSPTRRLSKIPSAANLAGENAQGGLARKPSTNRKDKDKDMEALGKVAAKNNIKGRTLVELQQARAGGRHVVPSSPKRPAAIWDPETDEMPSPFIVRNRPVRTAKEEGQ